MQWSRRAFVSGLVPAAARASWLQRLRGNNMVAISHLGALKSLPHSTQWPEKPPDEKQNSRLVKASGKLLKKNLEVAGHQLPERLSLPRASDPTSQPNDTPGAFISGAPERAWPPLCLSEETLWLQSATLVAASVSCCGRMGSGRKTTQIVDDLLCALIRDSAQEMFA